jgi:hypothetical protein
VGLFVLTNVTIIVSFLYLFVTGVGIFSSYILYRQFEINIFDYAETGDFLLAAFKSPSAVTNIAFTAAALVFGIPLIVSLLPALSRSSFFLRSLDERKPWALLIYQLFSVFTVLAPYFVVATIALVLLHVQHSAAEDSFAEADAIMQGEKPSLVVQYRSFSGSAGQVTKTGLELIGATQKVVFLYDVDEEHTLVIPQAQIVSIEVPSERQPD